MTQTTTAQDAAKRAAAEAAVAEVVAGMRVGLGTGSTAAYAIAALGERVRAGLAITAVATSLATERQARAAGFTVVPFEEVDRVDLTIDGVDEIDSALRAIKGAGGALLREKIVATASTRMIAVCDATKTVTTLGRGPLPVEILPFARSWVIRSVRALGGRPVLRLAADGSPARTDQANLLLDIDFGLIADPAALAGQLAGIPGVLDHGLFLREIDTAYVAGGAGVERRNRAK